MRALPAAALSIAAGLTLASCGGGARATESDTPANVGSEENSGPRDQVSETGEGSRGGRGGGGAASDDAVAPACPGSFAEAQRANGCAQGAPECSYPEGSCYCGEPRRCSGAAWEPMPPSMHAWQCTATPPDVRPDGCPGVAPTSARACAAGQRCSYGDCGGAVYGCVDGGWQLVEIIEPPP